MDAIQEKLLETIAGFHGLPTGAYNIRANGQSIGRNTTAAVDIIPKADGTGIDIRVKPGTKGEIIHIPVVMSRSGLQETVYNDFFIGENADVTIVAGCGIHNDGDGASQHDGIHRFFVERNARVKYVEKHYGDGDGLGARIMNPQTVVEIAEGGYMEMDTTQIKGVDSTIRHTEAHLDADAKLVVMERLMTHGVQRAESRFAVTLDGAGAGANIVSRSVAKDRSTQLFLSNVMGNAPCQGHTECDAIIIGEAKISAVPEISANHSDAALIHEAAIGKIAGEQIVKLMTLGLTEAEAEEQIINGFLK